jgi:hypothetical protein
VDAEKGQTGPLAVIGIVGEMMQKRLQERTIIVVIEAEKVTWL